MSLKWENISIDVLNTNESIDSKYLNLIKCNSGEVKKGKMLAIMGPSGGGKSTLLNALFGRIPRCAITNGKIFYNDKKRKINEWSKIAGFVDQDDVVYEDLTVVETLRYAALFRLKKDKVISNFGNRGDSKSKKFRDEIEKRIQNIIIELKLQKCYKNKMAKVSGGERKRVMIGIELISDPEILFLDEPTSGLDSSTSYHLIKLLSKIAIKQKKIILVTIHQPSGDTFSLFDDLLLLSTGNTIYSGKIKDTENFIGEIELVKNKRTPIPELLIRLCDNENNDSNYYENSHDTKKDAPSGKNTNDNYFNKSINFNHVKILISREIGIILKDKMSFIKSMFNSIVTYAILLAVSYLIKPAILFSIDNFLPPNNFSVEDKTKALFYDFRDIYIKFIYFFIFGMQIRSSAFIYLDLWDLIRREIAVGTYSALSLYTCFNIIQTSISLILSGFFLLALYFTTSFIVDDIFVFSIISTTFITIPIGHFIASYSRKKAKVIGLSSIVIPITTLFIPSLRHIINFVQGYIDINLKKFEIFAIAIVSLFPTSHLVQLSSHCIFARALSDSSEVKNMPFFMYKYNKYLTLSTTYFDGIELKKWQMVLTIIVEVFLFYIFGIFLLCYNSMPDLRLKLEN